MPSSYVLKPCRKCGGKKTTRGWYCEPCRDELWKKYDRNLCQSKNEDHEYRSCTDCARIKRQRAQEAAARGAATRAKNNAAWRKPFNAEKFWQSRAHSAVQAAIKRGVLPPLKGGHYACVDCGGIALEYDHRDYGRPLDVEPVCRSCNHARGTAIWPSADRYNFKLIAALRKAA